MRGDALIFRLIKRVEQYSEKKWLSSYSSFYSVSDYYVDKLRSFLNMDGTTIENGYLSKNYSKLDGEVQGESFVITYVGTLLRSQPIEIFIGAILKIISEVDFPIQVQFLGAKNTYDKRILELVEGFEDYFTFYDRVNKTECIELQHNSDLLLLISHNSIKGTPGSKMYEYMALKKPILVCPTDGEIMEETLSQSGLGFFVNNESEAEKILINLIQSKKTNGFIEIKANDNYIQQFDRKSIVKKLVAHLDSMG